MNYFLALDQGTTGTTALLVDATSFRVVGKVNREYPQIYPYPGQVEHDLEAIWQSLKQSVTELLEQEQIEATDIIGIGITNQRETICPFDEQGRPLYHALVWQDKRTQDFCQQQSSTTKQMIKDKTGLPLDPYFSATKMKWLLDNVEEIKVAADKKNLHLGTIDSFLLYRLTGGKVFKTEPSNASRTLLVNIETGEYDQELLDFFGIQQEWLPVICDSFSEFGETAGLDFLPDGITISGILGDQQAALFGQGCIRQGELKCTYGTGAFLLVNTEDKIVRSNSGLLTTIAYRYENKDYYALEGSSFIAGAAVQWLRDNLQIIVSAAESEQLARKVKDLKEMENILFFPFFSGLGSPYWVADAKAAIVGITRDSKKEHLVRACLEGICLAINDLIVVMESDLGVKIKNLRVDGGAVANDLLMEIQANISNLTVERPEVIETTALGASLAAAIGLKKYSFEQVKELLQINKHFSFGKEENYFRHKKQLWKVLINKLYL